MKEVSAHKLIKEASIGQVSRGEVASLAMAKLNKQFKEAPNQISKPLQKKMQATRANARFIDKQTQQFRKNIEEARTVSGQLKSLTKSANTKVKETGDVQHWAEMIERDIRIVEETLRLYEQNSRVA